MSMFNGADEKRKSDIFSSEELDTFIGSTELDDLLAGTKSCCHTFLSSATDDSGKSNMLQISSVSD